VDSQNIPNGVDGNDLYSTYAGSTIQVASSGDAADTLIIETVPITSINMINGSETSTADVAVDGIHAVGPVGSGGLDQTGWTEKVGSYPIVVTINPGSTGDWILVTDKDDTVLVSNTSMGSGVTSWNFGGNSIDTTNGIKITISF
jgi:hypothetical protein